MNNTLVNKDAQEILEIESVFDMNMYLSINRFAKKIVAENCKSAKYEPLLFHELKKSTVSSSKFYRRNCNEEYLAFLDRQNCKIISSMAAGFHRIYKPDNRIFIGSGISLFGNIQLIRIHSLYGVPYMPASAIKGGFRSCWINEKWNGDEEKALGDELFCKLFGGKSNESENKGALVFMDSYPIKFSIELDIQTPHYQKYYMKKAKLTDTESPIPLFLICLSNTNFKIYLGCVDKKLWDDNKEDIKKIFDSLVYYYGIGAKTSVGYGIMSDEN